MPSNKNEKIKFLDNYFNEFRSLISSNNEIFHKLIEVSELMKKSQKTKKK